MDDVHAAEADRLLYRQGSSMDFIKPGSEEIKGSTAIARLVISFWMGHH